MSDLADPLKAWGGCNRPMRTRATPWVYVDSRYRNSAQNLSGLSLDSEGIFADGWTDQLATVSGSTTGGYTASVLVRV